MTVNIVSPMGPSPLVPSPPIVESALSLFLAPSACWLLG